MRWCGARCVLLSGRVVPSGDVYFSRGPTVNRDEPSAQLPGSASPADWSVGCMSSRGAMNALGAAYGAPKAQHLSADVQDYKQFYTQQQPGSARGSGSSRSDTTHMATDSSPTYPYSPMAWVAPAAFAPMQASCPGVALAPDLP